MIEALEAIGTFIKEVGFPVALVCVVLYYVRKLLPSHLDLVTSLKHASDKDAENKEERLKTDKRIAESQEATSTLLSDHLASREISSKKAIRSLGHQANALDGLAEGDIKTVKDSTDKMRRELDS